MSRAHAGIDIGSRFVHIVVWRNGSIRSSVTEVMPEGLLKEGRVISPAAMGDYLKRLRKKYRLGALNATLALHDGECFCRRVDMPVMTAQQLKVNLPYEFRDFITGDKDKYFYDYAVLSTSEGEDKGARLELLAAAAPKESIARYRGILRRGGFTLTAAIPDEVAYMNMLGARNAAQGSVCMVDLGHSAIRLYMYRDGKYQSGRKLDYGSGMLDAVIADKLGVDPFLACTYRESNYQDCHHLPQCMDVYNSMALEIMKAVNYYNFSSPEQPLERVICCGGTQVEPLMDTLRSILPVAVEVASYPGGGTAISTVAWGAAMQKG